jgi:hypothetical protein
MKRKVLVRPAKLCEIHIEFVHCKKNVASTSHVIEIRYDIFPPEMRFLGAATTTVLAKKERFS